MNFSGFEFILYSLAVFRMTRLFVYDQIMEWFRKPFMMEYVELNADGKEEVYIAPKEGGMIGWLGALFSCYWCMGIWVATGLFAFHLIYPIIASIIIPIFAAAGLAALPETLIQWRNND